jgi:2-polyprenyl-3-methyl-5-hydroxy-6-metoxy-1,4-benzoquinol methylase
MDQITQTLKSYYAGTFAEYGATAKGVDWGNEQELLVRYDKMLSVLAKDFAELPMAPTMLDVGCGWGGLLRRAQTLEIPLRYSGIDVVGPMVEYGQKEFPNAEFICGDVFEMHDIQYDFVACNAILTQKLSVSIPEMERFSRKLILKMFELCRHGIVFNMMSTRVNFMVNNLFYQNPMELMSWLLTDVSPRVRLDHGYSSLINCKGKFFDFTVYVYKD